MRYHCTWYCAALLAPFTVQQTKFLSHCSLPFQSRINEQQTNVSVMCSIPVFLKMYAVFQNYWYCAVYHIMLPCTIWLCMFNLEYYFWISLLLSLLLLWPTDKALPQQVLPDLLRCMLICAGKGKLLYSGSLLSPARCGIMWSRVMYPVHPSHSPPHHPSHFKIDSVY